MVNQSGQKLSRIAFYFIKVSTNRLYLVKKSIQNKNVLICGSKIALKLLSYMTPFISTNLLVNLSFTTNSMFVRVPLTIWKNAYIF